MKIMWIAVAIMNFASGMNAKGKHPLLSQLSFIAVNASVTMLIFLCFGVITY